MKVFKKGIFTCILSALTFIFACGFVNGTSNIMLKTDAQAREIAPIAKYEFKDASNLGKDSMGNYDMEYRNAYVSGGKGELLNQGTLIEGGGVSFDGKLCLAQDAESNMFADVTSFTLCFEIMTMGKVEWQHFIGVGGAETAGDDYFSFVGRSSSSTRAGQLRINAHSVTEQYTDAPKIHDGASEPNDYLKVVVSVQPGAQIVVYLDGAAITLYKGNTTTVVDTTIGKDWKTATGSYFFSIGGPYNGAVDTTKTAKANLKNVAFYDFAMDANCVSAYNTNGKVTTDDVPVVGEVKGNTVTAEEDLGLNFYADIPGATTSATATMQMDGKEAVEVNGEYVEAQSAWKFTYPVAAKDYDKNVSFTLAKVDGVKVVNGVRDTYSVQAYIEGIQSGEYSESAKTLAASIATYCEGAKVYFDETAAALAEKVTGEVVAKADLTESKASLTGESDGDVTAVLGATLALEYKTMIHVYFTATDASAIVGAEAVAGADNLYVLKVAVVAKDLGKAQTITIGGYTLTYSAYSYIEATVDNADAVLYNVLQALYDYSENAKAYLG